MTDLAVLRARNAARWKDARPTRTVEFDAVARRLVAPAAKARFEAVSVRTGVPWFVIAVVKQREAGDDPRWLGNIANGQPWAKKTTLVPAGRGPFASWEAAACDALTACAPYAARNRDWSVGGLLTLLEQYNGLGYANRGVPSPYLWSGTDQYVGGKYVRDHVYDPRAIDKQLGCAGLLLAMTQLDPSIDIDGARPVPPVTSPPLVPDRPSLSHPAGGSVAAWLVSLFRRT